MRRSRRASTAADQPRCPAGDYGRSPRQPPRHCRDGISTERRRGGQVGRTGKHGWRAAQVRRVRGGGRRLWAHRRGERGRQPPDLVGGRAGAARRGRCPLSPRLPGRCARVWQPGLAHGEGTAPRSHESQAR